MDDDLRAKMVVIAATIRRGSYRYTVHGAQQRIARGLHRQDIEEAITGGEIVEDYPEHRYGPACLISGRSVDGRAIHVVCSNRNVVDIITVYEPDPSEWDDDFRTRRRRP